ncbi:MAG: extracellular solute-binding protein, partial [bacterium]|nr:extracellular solute-binding protein [bacterium]
MMKKVLITLFILYRFLSAGKNLIIISPHWEGVKIEITRAFSEWYEKNFKEKVKIEWIDQGGTSDDLKYVESLFKKNPKGIGIDLFFGGGLSPYLKLKEEGFLEKYKLPQNILKKIPKTCAGVPNYDNEFYWYGVVLSGFGILYNKKALKFLKLPFPNTWKDLGEIRYFSLVGAADPRHSGSMHMMYEIILQTYGWEEGWKTILSLAGNTKNFSISASEVARETSTGEVVVSLCIDSYALAQIEVNGKENMGFILPENQTVINPDCIGILKGAPNIEIAKRFIEFLFTYETQLLWIQKKGKKGGPIEYSLNRFPIILDVYS